VGSVKKLIFRLRKRYASVLREEVARTVSDSRQVDEEIHSLCEALIVTKGRLGQCVDGRPARRSCEGCWTYVFLSTVVGCPTRRGVPGCAIVFYIDTEQAKGVQFAWRPGPLIKRRSYCLQRHGCYWRLGEIPQQAMGGN
jgi:hypothetical protein